MKLEADDIKTEEERKEETPVKTTRIPARKKRQEKKKKALTMAACLAGMVAVMFLTVTVCVGIAEKLKEDAEPAIGEGSVPNYVNIDEMGNVVDGEGKIVGVLSDSVVYSQEQLEEQVADARQQAAREVLEEIRTELNGGDTILQTLRPLYPDDLIVYSGGQYHFVPINRSLKMHQRDAGNLNILDTGEYQYLQDGNVVSHKGIDVSRHQGEIDWNLVAQDGVEFAFIRVGYRGYGTGKLVEDEYFEDNIKGAATAGIKVGVYFYSQAINEEEVREEADFVLEKIAPYQIDCPVVFDVERVSDSDGRMNALTVEERTLLTQIFCQVIENAGYRPMIYHNTEMGVMMLEIENLENYDKWFAAYSDVFYYPYDHKIWQYSQKGSVQGIQGDVDLNISFEPLWE